MITDEGLRDFLEVVYLGSGAAPNFFAGLISDTGWTEISTLDEAGTHAGWTEEVGALEDGRAGDSGSRGVFGETVSAAGLEFAGACLANINMTFDAPTKIRGFFLQNTETYSDTTGVLFSVNEFPTPVVLGIYESLEWRYRIEVTHPAP